MLLSQNKGAVLQEMGKSNGYFWYSYASGATIDSDGVIREAGYQPARTAAGQVDAIASTGAHGVDTGVSDLGATLADTATHDTFYLYDAMAGSMNSGVLLHA